MKKRLTAFYTAQVNTKGDGIELPEGAELDSVEHVSQGEYVNVTYHVTREVEVEGEGDDGGAAA